MPLKKPSKTKYFFLLILLFFILFLTFQFVSNNNSSTNSFNLKEKKIIDAMAKITAKSVIINLKKPTVFVLTIETYQNPEILELNLVDTALLEVNIRDTYKPISWKIINKEKYKITGELKFPKLETKPNLIKLIVFNFNNKGFKWKI